MSSFEKSYQASFSPRRWGCFYRNGCFLKSAKVFPTQVGMFLKLNDGASKKTGFPHAGGDVSVYNRAVQSSSSFSPRRWGCFRRSSPGGGSPPVFPTQVGMFPRTTRTTSPRPRFSPRRWGCFSDATLRRRQTVVFPTQVGMFLVYSTSITSKGGFPHAGGDVSGIVRRERTARLFSPRRWGCFLDLKNPLLSERVFPTQVGMFPG